MCGIVGIIGNKQATEILVQGLEKLEYRGYDSAGIYVIDDQGQECLVKSKGRITDLKAKLTPKMNGHLGIGHTRWATHGEPTEQNAHPHTSLTKRFVLVHNGVIENFDELKQQFLPNHTFEGETDTEIVVNLIAYFSAKGLATKAAFQQVLQVIQGSYAFALIDNKQPDKIFVAKNKSPLLIGIGKGFNVICSDAMAMIHETDQFLEIKDEELVTVQEQQIEIENKHGQIITRESYKAQLDANDMEKGAYPHYMLKEINEQPSVIRRIVQQYAQANDQAENTIDQAMLNQMMQSDRIYIIACGTSYHAGWVGKNLIEKISNRPVEVHLSSEFGYNMPLLSAKPFFIFLSQSGETADSRQVLVQINQLAYPSLTVTNVAGSTLAREANYTLLLHAGPEIAVASTKAYTAQIAILAILAKALGEITNEAIAQSLEIFQELGNIASVMSYLIDEKAKIKQLVVDYLATTSNAFYIGRSVDYYVAMEAALKLKEISYIQAEGFAAGELKHGTIALIERDTPVFGVITDEKTAAHTRGNLKEVESRGAKNGVIVSQSLAKEGDQIVIPDVHPLLTPLVSIIPTQLIAYYATLQRGYDVDKPRNLAKSVTVE